MKIVVDTSMLIDHLRGGSIWQRMLLSFEPTTTLYVPTIVFFELLSGESTRRNDVARKMNDFMKHFTLLDVTESIARRAGEMFRDVTRDLSVPDYIVAASAMEIDGAVLTLNRKHFSRIPGLALYSL